MAQRSIGQEQFGFAGRTRPSSALDELAKLIDWNSVAALLDPLYPATKGEPAWPPVAMFRALLLSIWYDLSDVKLAEALDDRSSFRRFCGFSASEATPERTAFVRFRRLMVAHNLDRTLFEAVTLQLKSRAVTVKTGTFVGADADTALVEEVSITPANVNDGKAGPEALPDNPGEVFADSAYRGNHFRDAVRAKGGVPRIVATGMWGRDETETLRKLHQWNQPIHRVRGRIEKIFGTWKRSYGLRRMRWRGLAKAAVQVHLTAIAYNLKRTLNILASQP